MTTVLLVLGINILIWVPLLLWIRHRAAGAREQMEEEIGREPTRMKGRVRFFGRGSAGRGQVRGNGDLALTAEELVFVMWVPRRTLRIRRADISGVDTPRGFLGKTSGARLLRVHWRDGEGVDEAAWEVDDVDAWVAAIGVQS